jgi:dienelactone hydrolase
MHNNLKISLLLFCLIGISSCQQVTQKTTPQSMDWSTTDIPNLKVLAIDELRLRTYGSQFTWLQALPHSNSKFSSHFASYISDGLRVYARIDIPSKAAPKQGYPVVLFSHGWVGLSNAKNFDFFATQQGSQGAYLKALAENGFVVITPGWRGHGNIQGKQAQGIEFMQKWDNSSYLSPVFYAIDMLNALDSVESLSNVNWGLEPVKIDLHKISLSGHSQGGDSALLALAVAGESSLVKNQIHAASIFAGCFLPRLQQGELYGAMSMSSQAFMAGDGLWTGSAQGHNGEINPNFQFAFPPDWIGTTVQTDWTWQHDVWSGSTVKQAFTKKYDEMYDSLRTNDLTSGVYQLKDDEQGRTQIEHPDDILAAYAATSPINYPQYLQEPLVLHHSDRDYYSPTKWNEKLVASVVESGGTALNFSYPGNTHSLTISQHKWFSEDYNQAGLEKMIAHDVSWFKQPTQ